MKEDHVSKLIKENDYEFLDFGCSAGNSLEKYRRLFKAKGRGLGLDIKPEKVALTKDRGLEVALCDLTKLKIENKVRFVLMVHFLEHVPDAGDVEKIIWNACNSVTDFVFIRQPNFDADAYLFDHGFKFFWSDWSGHPNHMLMLKFHNILKRFMEKGAFKRFALYSLTPVEDSHHPDIHNIDSVINQHQWEEGTHTEKRFMKFDQPVFRETMAFIDIKGGQIELLEKIFKPQKKLFDSDGQVKMAVKPPSAQKKPTQKPVAPKSFWSKFKSRS